MPILADYCSLVEIKSFMRIADTADDNELGYAITAASRAIDQTAGRHFGVSTVEARYYTATQPASTNGFAGRTILETDDISTTTGLVVKTDQNDDGTFETTLTLNTDFRLWPYNADKESRPWERIVMGSGGTLPTTLRGVEVTAAFGWVAVPTGIKDAALIQASRFFVRRNAPFGVAGSPDMGSELRLLSKLDPDVAVIVQHYKRYWAWV